MMRDLAYLKLLAKEYPTVKEATSEIVNLTAICSLPKGTEYFFSDLHGEYEAFIHLLRSSSGITREKIKETFGHLIPEEEQVQLANLIYYPERNLARMMKQGHYTEDWQKITIYRLVQSCKEVSSKYTRSKVRKKMPQEFAYIIDELLHVDYNDDNKKLYYNEIIHSIIENDTADKFIIALCHLIQNLTIDNLHIIGDIYDRGPRADIIMNELMCFHDVDIQWGNHDISWMGAATGNLACICNVLRIAISYNSFDVLEDGYGINLRPLSMFAAKVYQDDPCTRFMPKILDENIYDAVDPGLAAKMHKAIAVIQFKVEGAMIKRHPEYEMDNRVLLSGVDFEKGTVVIEGKTFPMLDMNFPTVDPKNPLELSRGEKELLRTLQASFKHGELLHKHIRFLYSHGAIYKCYNSNLLYHGCIPMKKDGSFDTITMNGVSYGGKALMDFFNQQVQNAYFMPEGTPGKEQAMDIGLFAGTAVNDTSSVTAAAAAWDGMHPGANTLDTATIVKLTRTLAIIPITLALALRRTARARRAGGAGEGSFSLRRVFPFFLLFFMLASLITTGASLAGVDAAAFAPFKELSKFFIIMAMAAIGLNTDLIKLVRTGGRPILMGLCCWAAITAVSLGMQYALGLW